MLKNYHWMLPGTLSVVTALVAALPAFGQYEGYPSLFQYGSSQYDQNGISPYDTSPYGSSQYDQNGSSPYGAYSPQRVPLPPANSSFPDAAQPTAAPHASSPSENPRGNPFANVRGSQQTPVSFGNAQDQPAAEYQPATPSYHSYFSTSTETPQQPIADGATPLDHTQQVPPTPLPNSFYDQPAQSYQPRVDPHPWYDYAPKGMDCSTGLGDRPSYYGGVLGMVMTRDRADNVWLSYDQIDIRERVLNTNDADFSVGGGSGATVGRYFNSGQNSVQAVYWGIYSGTSEANVFGANTVAGLNTILHLDGLQYDAGLGGGAQDLSGIFFFDAERHRLRREFNVYNIELNLVGHNFTSGSGPWQWGWTAGIRYLRFDEDFLYSSDRINTNFTGDPREVHYEIDVDNNLLGFQVGGRADYLMGARLSVFAETKAGIYGNHISHRSRIYGANGPAFVGDPTSPYFGQDVDFTTDQDRFAMIGDLSVGARWSFNSGWSISAGYRAVGVSGVALSTNQIPVDFIGALDSIQTVNSNGSLILHGAFAGIDYNY